MNVVQSLHRLQCFIDLVQDFILIISVHGTVAYCSPTLITTLNTDPESLANSCILSLLDPSDALLLQASLANIHQQRSSCLKDSIKQLSIDHTLRFMHSNEHNLQVTTPVSVRIRPFILAPEPVESDPPTTSSFPDFDALFHPLMNGFRGSGRVSFPAFTPSLSTQDTSPPKTNIIVIDPSPSSSSEIQSRVSPRSDLYLMTGRLIPAGPHEAILDDVVPIILLNQRLRASLFRRYYSLSAKSLKQSKRPPINHQVPFIPYSSVLREGSLDPLLLAQTGNSHHTDSSTSSSSSSKHSFLLPDSNLTHVPPPLALSFGSSGIMIPNSEFVKLRTNSDPSSQRNRRSSNNTKPTSSSKTSSTGNRSVTAAGVQQFMPAIGHGSGLAGYMSPSDFVDANMLSIRQTEKQHWNSCTPSLSSSTSYTQRMSPQIGSTLDTPSTKKTKHATKRKHEDMGPKTYVCMDCGTNTSPEWRRGPTGEKCLCNACGLRFAKRKKLEREASSCTNALPLLQILPINVSITDPPVVTAAENPVQHDIGMDMVQPQPVSSTPASISVSMVVSPPVPDPVLKNLIPVSQLQVNTQPNQMQISPTTLDSSVLDSGQQEQLRSPLEGQVRLPHGPALPSYNPSHNSTSTNLMMPRYQQPTIQQQAVMQPEWNEVYQAAQDSLNLLGPSPESVPTLPSLVDLIRLPQFMPPPFHPPQRSISVSTWCDDNTISEEKSQSCSMCSTTETQLNQANIEPLQAKQSTGQLANSMDLDQPPQLDTWWSSTFVQPEPSGSLLPRTGLGLPPRYYYNAPASPLLTPNPATMIPQQQPPSTCIGVPITHFDHAGYLPTLHEQQCPPSATLPVITTSMPSVTQSSYVQLRSRHLVTQEQNTTNQVDIETGESQLQRGVPSQEATVVGNNPLPVFSNSSSDKPNPPQSKSTFMFPNSTNQLPPQSKNTIQYLQNLNALNKEKQLDAKQRLAMKPSSNKPKRAKKVKQTSSSSSSSSSKHHHHPQSLIQKAQINLASLNNAMLLRQDSVMSNRGSGGGSVCSTNSSSSSSSRISNELRVQQQYPEGFLRYQQQFHPPHHPNPKSTL